MIKFKVCFSPNTPNITCAHTFAVWTFLTILQQNTCYLYIVTQAEEVPQEVRQLPHPVNVAASTQFNSAKNRKAYRFIGAAGVTSDGKADQGGFGFVYSLIVNSLGVGYVGECGRIRVVEKSTQTVTTIVGALNSAGFTDEVGIKARIGSHPFLTFFPEENSNDASHGSGAPQIAIADYTNCAVRVLDPETGAVTTLAGSGTSVHKDGKAKAASFLYPLSIVSSQGYLYVVDASHTIRRISQLGDVVTLCGNPGAAGFSDNKGTSALLNTQTSTNCSITADPNTNTVYFYDTGNARMRAFVDPNLVLGAGSSSEAAAVASAGAVGSGGTSVSNACAGLGLPHDLAQDMREVLADADSCDVAFTGNESSRAPPTSKSSTSPLSSAVLMRSVGGFRRILSARSPYFRAMFDGNMHSRRSAATLPPPTTTAASAGAYAAVASSGTAAVHHDQVETIQLPYPLPVISAAIYFLHTDVLDLHWHEAKDHEEGKGGPGPAADLETKEASSAASSSNSFSSSSSSSSSSSASAASGAAAGRVGCSSSAAYDSASAGDFDVLLQLLGVAEAWHLPRLKQLVCFGSVRVVW